jgi:hypothetical protein
VLPYAAFGFVNWEAMHSALAFRSPSFCAWVTKHVTGECAVGRKMACWQLWDNDACPCCGQADEKTTHFARCENIDMMTAYKAAVDDLSAWMASADTDPSIAAYFSSVLSCRSFLPEDEEHNDQWMPDEMIPAMEEQTAIGWDNLLLGLLSTRWMQLQHQHLQSKHSRKSPERWAIDMTYKLLQISHKLWTTRNGILHEQNEQGLLLADGQMLTEAITERHRCGKAALLAEDYHHLDRSLFHILALPPSDKYAWLGSIILAHKFKRIEAKNPIARMRESMTTWLTTGYLHPQSTADDSTTNDTEDDEEDT